MHSYIRTLLPIILAASSTAIATPSQAQIIKELNLKNSNSNVLPISTKADTVMDTDNNISVQSKLDADGNSSASQSDSSTNTIAANIKSAVTNSNPRIPISSRIFPASSMQQ